MGLVLLGTLFASSQNQQRKDAQSFVGSWSATHRGAKYLALRVLSIQPLSGEVRTGQVNADENGNISEVVEEATKAKDMIEPRIVADRLLFKTKDSDGEFTEYEMTLITPDEASLKITGMPIKPFLLTRDRAAK